MLKNNKLQYSFRLTGRIIPYVRMTRRGKFTDPRAQAYLASQEALRWQLKEQMAQNCWDTLPQQTPLRVEVTATVPSGLYTFDVDNIGKAAVDAAQGIVFFNDCWIAEVRFTKALARDHEAFMFVSVV